MINKLPLISIVTPSLNQGAFIEDMIQSVLSQCYPRLEFLIYDGGSEDETIDILKKYDSFVYWNSQKDNGQVDAINHGLKESKGEILAYLNADDILLPGSLERVGHAFANRPKMLWLTGRCDILNESGMKVRNIVTHYKNMFLFFHSYHALLVTNFISQPATFWRREALYVAGYLDDRLNYVMDYEYWLRLWRVAPPYILHKSLAGFRVHSRSKTTSAGHLEAYIHEEENIISQYTSSSFWLLLHNIHRWVMTTLYARINSK